MDLEYDAWRVSAHNAQICGDCHLPAETVSHYAWDAYFGMRDMWEFFVTGDYPEIIRAKPVSQDFLADNCLRCHGAKVHAARVEDRRCWDCHRSVMHRQTLWGIEQGARLPR
jgi:cytochrome c nitrite reductase small subunit